MRVPLSGLKIDNPAFPLLQALISYWGTTDNNGNVGGTTIRCGGLALEPPYDNHALKILSGASAGQTKDITVHPAGTDTLTVASAFTNVTGAAQQILAGTRFVVLSKTPAIAEVAALTALVQALMLDVGDASTSVLGSIWDILGNPAVDLATSIAAILAAIGAMNDAKPNVQEVIIYPVAEDAGTDELAQDGSDPPWYPAAAHSTATNAEGAPGVAWVEDIDFEQEGTITIISIYAEFEWQTRFLVGAGAGTQSSSKIQISRDGGANWVDLTDNFNNAAAVMTNRIRAGVGVWIPTIVAGANQLQFRLVHWTDDGGAVSTSEAQIRSNSFARIIYRKS